MEDKLLKMLFAVGLAATLAAGTPVSATTTYFYAGMINPTNSRDGGVVNKVGLHAPMTFTFTTADPIAPNSDIFNDAGAVLSWTASAGQP